MRFILDVSSVDLLTVQEHETPLHVASRRGDAENVTLLLQHGALPDAVTLDSQAPLHLAAIDGHESVALALLEHGADPKLTTKVLSRVLPIRI